MIILSSPITITPPPYNGKEFKPITFTQIDWFVVYDNARQSATATIKPTGQHLTLWNKNTTPSYDQAGQFTDADVDARMRQFLNVNSGNDAISAVLLALYPKPAA